MFGIGHKRKKVKVLSASEGAGVGMLVYKCPHCKQRVAAKFPLTGHGLERLKKEISILCGGCGKDITLITR